MLVRDIADGRKARARTREDIIQALRDYAAEYGSFTTAAFNPSVAKWRDEPALVERYYRGNPRQGGASWPSLNSIKGPFGGSFNAALTAAGLPINTPGPARGRRPDHQHAPIRDVRERLVYMPNERLLDATARSRRLAARLAAARARAERAEAKVAELRARPPVVRERVVLKRAPAPVTKIKTVEKKVRDERALERLRTKLSTEQELRKETEARLKAERGATARALEAVSRAQEEASEASDEARSARAEHNRLTDRLAAAEGRVERLRDQLAEAEAGATDVRERALAADLVQAAERRVEMAELRAARAEREMAEQASAITGDQRKLSRAEMDELRAKGPAGRPVFVAAVTEVARARARTDLDAALLKVARAAVTWRSRL